MKQVAGRIKGDLAQYRELAAFAQFGSDLDAKTQGILERGKRVVEIFKQQQYNPLAVELQVATLWAVMNNHYDDVPVDRVKEFQMKFQDSLGPRKEAVLAGLRDKPEINDANAAALKEAIAEFKQGWR